MADESILKLFGFELKRSRRAEADSKKLQSPVPAVDDDASGYVTAAGSHFGQYLNMDNDDAKDNSQLIQRYRGIAMHPECDAAIEDIVNEAITTQDEQNVSLILDNVKVSDQIKKTMTEEFDTVVSMLNFTDYGHDIFRRWYIDGRIFYHLVVDDTKLKEGIQEIRPLDAAKTTKIRQVKYKKDTQTGIKIVDKVDEYFLYQDKPGLANSGIKLSTDAVCYVTSGLLDQERKKVVSFLHKALKPVNQLRMMEDSLVIYRLARAPERRVFYVDIGNLPKGKAEEYMKNIMARYRNKLVYDANTGQIKDDRKHMSMLEDFWLPRREGGRSTEITTLPGGENLGQIDDIIYFQKRLYRALNVPINRLEQEAQFSLGRSTEISRDEIKFQKFIDKLRKRFSRLFLDILKKQLILKGIITEEDWDEWKNDIVVNFINDNYFAELKEMDILRERLQALDQMSQYVGEYYSKEWVMKNVLQMDDDRIKQMKKEISGEQDSREDGENDSET